MNKQSNSNDTARPRALAWLACLSLWAGSASLAGDVTPRNSGAVSVPELRTLLSRDLFFQIFDFEVEHDFCIYLQVIHQIDGYPQDEEPAHGKCWTSGPMSLIFKIEESDGTQRMTFGLYHRETGGGGHFTLGPLPISQVAGRGFGWQTPDTSVRGNQRLFKLSLTERVPEMQGEYRKHELLVEVRFEGNPDATMGTAPRL